MLEKMNFFVENWYIIVTFICTFILALSMIIKFIGYPTEKKIKEIKERLLAYVTEAELDLGNKTGALKLAKVYDQFCEAFPETKKWISFEKFSSLVDEVLPKMREILEKMDTDSEEN